jgi:uncharacterized membrane protein
MTACGSHPLILALALSVLSIAAQGKPSSCYRLTHIGPQSADEQFFFVEGMNDKGEVVGGQAFRAFLWRDGQFVDLPAPLDHAFSFAQTINDHSDIAGTYEDAQFQSHAALLRRDGTVIELHGIPGERFIVPLDMNNHRQILGASFSAATGWQDFIWHRGQVTLLEQLPNDSIRQAAAINDHGVATGTGGVLGASFAVLWQGDGTVMPLPRPEGAPSVFAADINNRGQVLANAILRRPYIWDEGEITVLGLVYPDQTHGEASDINNRGVVAGATLSIRTLFSVATLWRHATPVDVNTLLCADDPLASHVHLSQANLINDRDQVVASGSDDRMPNTLGYYFLSPTR